MRLAEPAAPFGLKIELDGRDVVAIYPCAEHAWLLGMAAHKSKDRAGL